MPSADAPDWRWLFGRGQSVVSDCPFFGQHEPGNWGDVIRRVADAIAVLSRTLVSDQAARRG